MTPEVTHTRSPPRRRAFRGLTFMSIRYIAYARNLSYAHLTHTSLSRLRDAGRDLSPAPAWWLAFEPTNADEPSRQHGNVDQIGDHRLLSREYVKQYEPGSNERNKRSEYQPALPHAGKSPTPARNAWRETSISTQTSEPLSSSLPSCIR